MKPSSAVLEDFARAAKMPPGATWRVIEAMKRIEQQKKGPSP
jgi:hypothetical protein